MAEIPLHWRAYAAHQSRLNDRSAADSVSWGSEAALNFLVEADNFIGAPGQSIALRWQALVVAGIPKRF